MILHLSSKFSLWATGIASASFLLLLTQINGFPDISNTCQEAEDIRFYVSHNYGRNGITKVFSTEAISSEPNLPIGGRCLLASNNSNLDAAPRGHWLQMKTPGTPNDRIRVRLSTKQQ